MELFKYVIIVSLLILCGCETKKQSANERLSSISRLGGIKRFSNCSCSVCCSLLECCEGVVVRTGKLPSHSSGRRVNKDRHHSPRVNISVDKYVCIATSRDFRERPLFCTLSIFRLNVKATRSATRLSRFWQLSSASSITMGAIRLRCTTHRHCLSMPPLGPLTSRTVTSTARIRFWNGSTASSISAAKSSFADWDGSKLPKWVERIMVDCLWLERMKFNRAPNRDALNGMLGQASWTIQSILNLDRVSLCVGRGDDCNEGIQGEQDSLWHDSDSVKGGKLTIILWIQRHSKSFVLRHPPSVFSIDQSCFEIVELVLSRRRTVPTASGHWQNACPSKSGVVHGQVRQPTKNTAR